MVGTRELDSVNREVFEAVVVCTVHHTEPVIAAVSGEGEFRPPPLNAYRVLKLPP